MRGKTESGKVVSSHSSACGAISLTMKRRMDSRSWSCSSVKMKCLRWAPKSGFSTLSVAAMAGPYRKWCVARPTFRSRVRMRAMDLETVAYTADPETKVARIALDHPDTRNALSDQLLDDLLAA